jgi:hypothetical protein
MSLQSNNIKNSTWNWIIKIATVSQWNGPSDAENFSEQVIVGIYFVYAYLKFSFNI